MIDAREQVISPNDTKCISPFFKIVRYLIVGELSYGPFLSSFGNKYVLVAVEYISRWFEAQALPTNNAKVVVKFLKRLFNCFSIPRVIISDRCTHFCNQLMKKVLKHLGVTHKISTSYHPQTSRQVEVVNHDIKRILEKTMEKPRKY